MDNMKPETTDYSDIRAQLSQLLARYDGGVPPAVFSVIRKLETELSWLEHRGRHRMMALKFQKLVTITNRVAAKFNGSRSAPWRQETSRATSKLAGLVLAPGAVCQARPALSLWSPRSERRREIQARGPQL